MKKDKKKAKPAARAKGKAPKGAKRAASARKGGSSKVFKDDGGSIKRRAKPATKPAGPRKQQKLVPQGMAWINPYLTVADVAKAIDFYERAFGFKRVSVHPGPGGMIMHAELRHESQHVMLSPAMPEMGGKSPAALGGSPVSLYVYVRDVDLAFDRARDAGAKVLSEPEDMFWGDRYCRLEDPEGHQWSLAEHVREVSAAEMKKAAEKMMGGGEECAHGEHDHEHSHGGETHDHEHDHGHGEHGHGEHEHHAHDGTRPSHS